MAAQKTTESVGGKFVMDAGDRAYKANDLLGAKVVNQYGEYLGKIVELAIYPKDGRVTFAVLSRGGFLGLGEKLIAIPFDALSMRTDRSRIEQAFVLNMDKAQLDAAPTFESHSWGELSNRQWAEGVYSYYGQKPYWKDGGTLHVAPVTNPQDEVKTQQ